ncbi:response regulator [Brevibacillus humidisoli]|uniref:response regulator transcription factor n=1 Tax=Brevibacillus humidisoli TaxID=2895522 RepID=UPI001E2F53C2|nr:response regulator [Brevibacillus humidisoli]UFJ39541.1 response regulator [Brevibacillus humidisoli]
MDIKAMLVDDEVNILKNLQVVVPWEALGVEIVGLARNGIEAMELYNRHTPDLVLTDIRMPMMDGIGLVERIREGKKPCEIIMLTGYKDFEYTRSAIRSGVRDYIVKPINYQELHDVIRRVSEQIRLEKQERQEERKRLMAARELAYKKFLLHSLMGLSMTHGQYLLLDQEIHYDEPVYHLLVVDMDDYAQQARFWSQKDRELWNFAVQNVLEDVLTSGTVRAAVLQVREGEWCILTEQNGQMVSALDLLREWAEKMQRQVEEVLQFSISVGLYRERLSIHQLARRYEQVRKAIHFDLTRQHKAFLLIPEEGGEQGAESGDNVWWRMLEELIDGLQRNDLSAIRQALARVQQGMQGINGYSLVRVEQMLRYFVLHLVREMRSMKIITTDQEEQIWEKLEASRNLKDLFHTIRHLLENGVQESVTKKTSETLMVSAKAYIDRHLTRDLGVEEVAGYLGISCSYFSLLFKQRFSETFVEYVTRQRIERAQSMLVMSSKNISEISRAVGYPDRRYFSKVFQKCVGITPSEYREKAATKSM